MTGYDREYEDNNHYILSYIIENNFIGIKYFDGDVLLVPYSEYNENQIIDKMKNESNEIDNYLQPKAKRNLLLYIGTTTSSLLAFIAQASIILLGNFSMISAASIIMLSSFTVTSAIFLKDQYKTIQKFNERQTFFNNKLSILNNKQIKPHLRIVTKDNNEYTKQIESISENNKNYTTSELITMANIIKDKLRNREKNNNIEPITPPILTLYTNEQMTNVKTLKQQKKKK